MWEKIAALSALISVCVSIYALYISKTGADRSSELATEALKTARQANDITLGLVRESPVIEIFSYDKDVLNFTKTDLLNESLKVKFSIRNSGKVAIDGLAMEIIGIEPLTYPENNPDSEVRPLPSVKVDVGLETIIQPTALAHIDMRLPILLYLKELNKLLTDKEAIYRTTINVVFMPKAIGDSLPSGVNSNDSMNDRKLITIKFKPSITSTEWSDKLIMKNEIAHRVYSP